MKLKSKTIILRLAEEWYAIDSGEAYEDAENKAARVDKSPDYPEPFRTIGSGFGALNAYVKKHCGDIATELGLDIEFCNTVELIVTLYAGTDADYSKYVKVLGDRLHHVEKWILNFEKVWPELGPR